MECSGRTAGLYRQATILHFWWASTDRSGGSKNIFLLGMFERASYEEEEATLAPGEYAGGIQRRPFPRPRTHWTGNMVKDRLMASVAAECRLEPDALLELLLSRVRAFVGDCAQADDMTALVVRRSAAAGASV